MGLKLSHRIYLHLILQEENKKEQKEKDQTPYALLHSTSFPSFLTLISN